MSSRDVLSSSLSFGGNEVVGLKPRIVHVIEYDSHVTAVKALINNFST